MIWLLVLDWLAVQFVESRNVAVYSTCIATEMRTGPLLSLLGRQSIHARLPNVPWVVVTPHCTSANRNFWCSGVLRTLLTFTFLAAIGDRLT